MSFARPNNLEQALKVLAGGPHIVLAGGTDVYPALGQSVLEGDVLDLSAIPDLAGIAQQDGFWRIGALTSWRDVAEAELPNAFSALQQAAREVGSVQIQNRATVAGNICNASPAADGVPPLLVLDALVELSGMSGQRRIKLADFIIGNRQTLMKADELMTAILLPDQAVVGQSTFTKLGIRAYLVISIAMVAVRLDVKNGVIMDAALAVGACSAVAQRLPELEAVLIGKAVSDDLTAVMRPDHLSRLSPIDDVRASSDYRLDVVPELITSALMKVAGGYA